MHQSDSAFIIAALQIRVKLPKLSHQEHALIHNRPAGKGGDVSVGTGLLKHAPSHIQPAVERQALFRVRGALYEPLFDAGHFRKRLVPKRIGADGHFPPAQEFHAFLFHDQLKHALGL